jgi:uncharacterized protein (TIGR02996 family)
VTPDLEQTLLRAIHENPADDTPWLVLADWLEEQGDPRAELVRLQLLLRQDLDEPDRLQREKRLRQLIQAGVRPCAATLTNSVGMQFVLIRPGVFWMGSPVSENGRYADESPRHRVRITRPFYLGRYPVTQQQYQRVTRQRPSNFRQGGGGAELVAGLDTSRFPVESVSWLDAVAFCAALSARPAEQAARRRYRLPSEAEWEYACRAGAAWSAPFHFGYSLSSRQANFDGAHPYGRSRPGPNLRRPCAVGNYRPNAWGLYDMHGNVWEWVADWFDEDYYEVSPEDDPPGPTAGESRVLRGGSFYYIGSSCRAAIRFGRRPSSQSSLDGFRVAMTCDPSPPADALDD